MMAKRFLILIPALLLMVSALFGCTKKDGSEKLCEFLFSGGYEAEFDYSFSDGAELSGKAKITKNDKVRIEFLSPDAFSSLSVESDEKGEPGVLIFNYYGIRTPLPEGALSKISLLLSFFSDEMPKGVLSEDARLCEYNDEKGEFPENTPLKECRFTEEDGTQTAIVFDASSGFPKRFSAVRDTTNVQIDITKLVPRDSIDSQNKT